MLPWESFPLQTFDKLRYSDMDRQGHVNNAQFSTFLETGRVEMLYNSQAPLHTEHANFVIASLQLQFIAEIVWPGQVDIGTALLKIGNSSMTIYQQLFQQGRCVAAAETVIVQVDQFSGKSKPLSEGAKKALEAWLL